MTYGNTVAQGVRKPYDAAKGAGVSSARPSLRSEARRTHAVRREASRVHMSSALHWGDQWNLDPVDATGHADLHEAGQCNFAYRSSGLHLAGGTSKPPG